MKGSLRALLSHVIDYAGLFPPAELSLDESIRNYARYRQGHEAWMLGRFICPAARLHELVPYVEELFDKDHPPLAIAALGRGGKTPEDFVTGFGRDVQAILDLEDQLKRRVEIRVLETRLPAQAGVAFEFDSRRLRVFVEPTLAPDWRRSVRAAVDIACSTPGGCGFKMRTGGVEAAAFPPGEQIAHAIVACREKNVPLKFTAGLHHPIRHYNASIGAKMHGFVNVFVAGVMAHMAKLDEEPLVEILEDEDPDSFAFDDASLRWRDRRATVELIEFVRANHVMSFGSCSFDEPRDDLRALGWL
jgi:hypothetical protein